jgi:hypothetical protein
MLKAGIFQAVALVSIRRSFAEARAGVSAPRYNDRNSALRLCSMQRMVDLRTQLLLTFTVP